MAFPGGNDLDALLRAVEDGDERAREQLLTVLHEELHSCAARMMRAQPAEHTLQATALVNEAYLKLFSGTAQQWEGRRHVLATAATAMRQVLIDHARKKLTGKRRAEGERVPLDLVLPAYEANGLDLIALGLALEELAAFDPLMARVVDLRFFAGREFERIAEDVDVPLRTLQRKWQATKAWLFGRVS